MLGPIKLLQRVLSAFRGSPDQVKVYPTCIAELSLYRAQLCKRVAKATCVVHVIFPVIRIPFAGQNLIFAESIAKFYFPGGQSLD